jgi:hypothetical protein
MQKIEDKKIIYNTIEEIMDPSHTALVVWDVQNMLVNRIFNRQEFTSNISGLESLVLILSELKMQKDATVVSSD